MMAMALPQWGTVERQGTAMCFCATAWRYSIIEKLATADNAIEQGTRRLPQIRSSVNKDWLVPDDLRA